MQVKMVTRRLQEDCAPHKNGYGKFSGQGSDYVLVI